MGVFNDEESLLQELGVFCDYGKFPDHLSKIENWQLRKKAKSYTLERPTEEEAKAVHSDDGPTDWEMIKKINSVRTACQKAISYTQSELAEFLYTQKKKKNGKLDAATLYDKICVDLSGSCKRDKSKKRKKKSSEL